MIRSLRIAVFGALLWIVSVFPAFAQSGPNWSYGFVPTQGQWQAEFQSKQDYLGAAPCIVSGCTLSGKVILAASTTLNASLNIPVGVPPTTPNNGDVWATALGVYVQVNGTTIGPLASATSPTITNLTVTGSFTATGLVTNADLANASTTVNGQTCTLGATCTITASAGTVTVGTTTVAGSTSGHVLYNNAGVLGDYAITGTGSVVMSAGATITGATLTTATLPSPIFSGTVTGTYTIGGSPSIAGSAINSGTVSGSYISAVNLAINTNGGVTGVLPIGNGGTGQTTAAAAIAALMPTPVRAGDIALWNGTIWTTVAGNNSGTQVLQETSAGVASWVTIAGTGTVTSVTLAGGNGVAISGTNPITSAGTITLTADVPPPQGRITLAANTPVMTPTSCGGSACSNITTLRYDCAQGGGNVPYWDGTIDHLDPIASCEVTDAMISAASAGQVVSSQVYDVWWVHGGANRICLAMSSATGGGGGWASDTGGSNTARGTGYTVLDFVTRPYVTNKNAIANCFNGATNYGSVSANQGTYLGTVYASVNGAVTFKFGSSGVTTQAAFLGVWNYYNQVDVKTMVRDSTGSFLNGSTTPAPADYGNAGTANRISFITGVPLNGASVSYVTLTNPPNPNYSEIGICLDCINSFNIGLGQSNLAAQIDLLVKGDLTADQILGFHYFQAVEWVNGGVATFYYSGIYTNLSVELRM